MTQIVLILGAMTLGYIFGHTVVHLYHNQHHPSINRMSVGGSVFQTIPSLTAPGEVDGFVDVVLAATPLELGVGVSI